MQGNITFLADVGGFHLLLEHHVAQLTVAYLLVSGRTRQRLAHNVSLG